MKKIIKFFFFLGMCMSPLLAFQSHAIVLQYHRFNEAKYPSTDISMKLFTQQIEYLVKNNYKIWPLSKVLTYLLNKQQIPEKIVVLTMDDAYKSVYTQAYPLLKKYHLPFTVFVNSLPVIHESKRYMSWDEMREMGKNGAEFANHTYSHQYLVRQNDKNAQQYEKFLTKEIPKCEIKIEKELGSKVCTQPKMLAYPFGEYDNRLKKLLKEMGYVGVAQNSAPVSEQSDLLALTRFPMSGGFGKMKSFMLKINTLPLPLKSVENVDAMLHKENNPPRLVLELKKPLKDLQCFTSNGKKITMQWLSDRQVAMQAQQPLAYPRDHYTCTARATGNKWYWYSHFWVIKKGK